MVDASRAFAVEIDNLSMLFDRYRIGLDPVAPLTDTPVAAFEDVTDTYNHALSAAWKLEAYCYVQVAVDAGNEAAQALLAAYQRQAARLDALHSRYATWLADLNLDALVSRSPLAATHSGTLQFLADTSQHVMSQAEEALATNLSGSGATGWSRLYHQIWSSMTATIEHDGMEQSLPMSRIHHLGYSSDRKTRRRAYAAEQAAWTDASVPLAAALNGVMGWALTLATRRGWASPLNAALAANRIDHATLDAMMTAARESFPDFRRYLRAKARALGLNQLAWYDLSAPVTDTNLVIQFQSAFDLIHDAFARYSPGLQSLAKRAFDEQWLDVEPRPGKRGGAFTMAVGDGTSRILTNFEPVFGEVRVIAHELGHAYHYHVLHREQRTPLRQMLIPMTLSETASIFCETLVFRTALETSDPVDRLAILQATIDNHCRFVVDVSAGFLMEQQFVEARRKRELTVAEINNLMVAAQRETYGDAIDPRTFHPYMWAARPHLFDASQSFMNFPYMFGLLFSLGLFAHYQTEPASFSERFDTLLASTGESDPATLAATFGIYLRDPAFWRASLDVIRADIDEFERLVGAL